jgi:hypothetical protein
MIESKIRSSSVISGVFVETISGILILAFSSIEFIIGVLNF